MKGHSDDWASALAECEGLEVRFHPDDLRPAGRRLVESLGCVVVLDEKAPRAEFLGDPLYRGYDRRGGKGRRRA